MPAIAEIAALLGLPFRGDGARLLTRVSGWDEADASTLVFLDKASSVPSAAPFFSAGCVIAIAERIPEGANAIVSENPKLDFCRAAAFLRPPATGAGRRDPTASVSADAEVGADVDIGPQAVVESGAKIGSGTVLHAGVVVGAGCSIGKRCTLQPRVVLYPKTVIGECVILHAGVVLGSDGFGYVFDGKDHVKFPQAGRVVVEDDVEIGANTTVDRGSLGVTRIGRGTKIDNLVQIAHNVQIGRSVVIASQTGISGSTVIEDYAVIGGQVGFGDHARVEKGVIIGSKAGVLPGKIVRSGETYWGIPVRPLREFKRLNALFGRLPEIKADLDLLKKSVAELEEATGKKKRKE